MNDFETKVERFPNGKFADLKMVQNVGEAITKAIAKKNPRFKGAGVLDAANAVIDILAGPSQPTGGYQEYLWLLARLDSLNTMIVAGGDINYQLTMDNFRFVANRLVTLLPDPINHFERLALDSNEAGRQKHRTKG